MRGWGAKELLLAAAVLLFGVAALIDFGVVNGTHVVGWIAAGLVAFALAHFPWRTDP